MSASSSFNFSARLQAETLPLSLALWGAYMVCLTVYCVIYQRVVSATPADFMGTGLWILQNWCIWLLITPVLLGRFRQYVQRPGADLLSGYLWLGSLALLAALILKILLDALTLNQGPASILLIYSPKYLAALAAVTLFWHFLLRPESQRKAATLTPTADTEQTKTLLVSKGNDKCLIRVSRIQWVSAAGNYMEIHCDDQVYLLRTTMKQMTALLPTEQFIRVHRSHIVNLDEIDRIKTQAAGNGTVHLRCGRVLKISKACRARLRQPG